MYTDVRVQGDELWGLEIIEEGKLVASTQWIFSLESEFEPTVW